MARALRFLVPSPGRAVRFRPFHRWLVPLFSVLAAISCKDTLKPPPDFFPARIDVLAGDFQSGVVGQRVADTLVVKITDSDDLPVEGAPVTFQVVAGGTGAELIPATDTTDAEGLARAVWVLGHLAGQQRVDVRVNGASGLLTRPFTATAQPDAPDTVFAVKGEDQLGIVSRELLDSLAVVVTDQFGNPIEGQTVNWTVPGGQGSVSAATTVTGADGRAAVTRTLGPTAGTQTATATRAGLKGSPVTFTSTASPGGATKLAKLWGDTTVSAHQVAPAGQRLTDSLVVQTQDANGNGVSGQSVVWTVTSGGGSVSSPSSITDAEGKAFVFLTLGTTAGQNTVRATSPGLTPVDFAANGIAAQAARIAAASTTTQNGTAGLPVGTPPSVRVTDINNNAVQGVTVSFQVIGGSTVSDGTGSGPAATVATNASGIATLASWTLDPVAGANTVTASAVGAGSVPLTGSPVTFNATGAVGPAAQLAVTTQPSATAASGAPLAVQPVVQLRDAFDNNVSQSGVNVTVAVSTGGTLTGTATVATNASGRAVFSGLAITGLVGNYTLTFTSGTLTAATSNAITLGVGTATRLAITTQPSATAQNGVPLTVQPVVQLRDNGGNNVSQPGVNVTVAVSTGGTLSGTTTVATNGSGQALFSGLAINGTTGNYTLTFTSGTLTGVTSNAIALGAGGASRLAITTQPSATAQSGVALGTQPVVQLRDAGNNNVLQANVSVTAAVSAGTLTGTATVLTNASGQAVFSGLTISGTAGTYTLTFSSGALTPATSNNIALSAGPATQLVITTQPSAGAQSGVVLAQQPVVQLRDNGNNNVSSGGISVTAAVSTGGTLGGTATVLTNASGQAVFSGLSISGASGSYTLTFTSGTLTPATSSPITLGAGAPTKLSTTTQPSAAATSGTAFGTQPVIQLLDASNNPVALAGINVTVAIGSGTGATLTTTLTVATNASGQAVFSGLTLTGTVGTFTLTFSSSGLTPITSNNIVLSAGAANKLTITTQPSATASSGVAFATQPVIQLRDASNNPVSQSGVVVNASIQTGTGATLGGTLTATTNASGVATFTNLMLTGAAGNFTLNFASGALTPIASTNIALGAGAATRLTLTTQPSSSATNGVAFGTQPVIQLRDASNNPVSQANVVVTAVIATGTGAVLSGATATTNASGVASFTSLTLTGTVGSFSLSFTSGALTPVTSGSIALSAGPATQLTITVQPPATAQSGVAFVPQPVIQLRDVSLNPVSSANVAVTAAIATGTGGSLSNTIALTNASGAATFSGLTLSGTTGSFTLRFSSGSLTSVVSTIIGLGAGTGSNLSVTTQPSAAANSGAVFAQQPAIQLRDAANNPVLLAGVTVTAGLASGNGTLGGTLSATTNASGVATFANLAITGLIGNYTLLFSAPAYTSVLSNTVVLAAGAPASVAINTQPSATVQSGVVFPIVPVVTVTDGGGNLLPGQSVTLSVESGSALTFTNGTAITNVSGQATFTGLVATGVVGARTLRFTAGAASAVSSTVTVTAGVPVAVTINTQPSATVQSGVVFPVVPVVTVTDGASNPVPNQSVTITVATGSALTFTNGTATTNSSGQATFTGLVATGVSGARTLRFTAGAATATSTTVTVNPAPTSTAVGSSANPSSFGQSVTFTATVTGTGGTPTGTVQFKDGAANLGAAVALVGGVGTLSSSALAVGAHSITAVYSGDASFATSTSPVLTQTVNPASTTTTITNGGALGTASVVGQGYAVNYSVAVVAPGAGTPTGNVTVSDGTASCTATVAAGTCTLTSTTAGAKTLTATYAGATNFATSTSTGVAHNVNAAATTTAITADTPDPSTVNVAYTVNYAVTVNAPGAGTPTGNVTVSDGTASCTGTVAAGTCSLTSTSTGAKTLTATYAGDGNFATSTSAGVGHTVNSAATTTTISSDLPDPSVVGQAVTINFSVTGSPAPTGTVTVSDGTQSCNGTLASNGNGTCNITFTSVGSKNLTATYGGDATYSGSTSAPVPHQVNAANTTTTITSDTPDPTSVGQPYAVNYTVVAAAPGAGTPTGNVTVSDGAASCTATVAAGTCTLASTTNGPKTLTATYAGSANFNGSSGTTNHTVNASLTTTTITSDSPDPSTVNTAYPVTYTVDVTAPGAGTPTGNVTVSDGTASCTATVAAGTCNLTSTSTGAKTLTATYAGDANFTTSNGTTPHTVSAIATTTTITGDTPEPSVVGQTVTVSFTVAGGATPTGTVTVSDGTQSCNGALTAGAGSCNIAFSTAGAKNLTATYGGDATHSGSTSAAAAHTVNAASTTTSITSDTPDPSSVGQAYAVAYSVAVTAPGAGTPTGNVTVSDGTASCTATVAAGTCNLTSTSTGAKTLTATYAGDANFTTSNGTTPHQVNAAGTTTTITGDTPEPSVVGQTVTINFSVTGGATTPTGTVTVSDGTQSCNGALTAGAGSCTIAFSTAGAKNLTATYGGDATHSGSTSVAAAHAVNAASTTTSITSDTPDPSVVGQGYPVNYSVVVVAPGAGTPTGNVTVSDGTASCTATVAAGTCTLTSTTAGAKTLTATYAGTANFATSNGTTSHQVNAAATTTTITSDTPDPSTVNTAYPVNYTVAVAAPGAGTPTGNVTVSDGTASCTATVAAGTCNLTSTSTGAKTLTATYAGDGNFATSSGTTAHQVNASGTTTSITSDNPDPSVVGQAVTVAFSVTGGATTPTGTVTVSDGTQSCNGALTAGAGSCNIAFSTAGAKNLTATYGGDATHSGSASAAAAHTVNAAATTTAITSDTPDPSTVNVAFAVNYTVTVTAPGAGTPTGNVTVSDGTANCTATVAAGTCNLTPTSTGAKTLTATYAGDGNFATSNGTTPHQVNAAGTTTSITSDNPDPSVVGQAVTVAFSVTGGATTPTGTVTVSDGTQSCNGALTAGAGSCNIAFSTAGAKNLTATYGGDATHSGSTSVAAAHTVDKAATTVAIGSDTPDPSVTGQAVTVTFSVTAAAPGAGTPTGNVTVSDGTDSCIGTVAAGTCNLTSTTAGAKTLTATYAGDANFNGNSGTAAHTVDQATTTTVVTSSLNPSLVGQAVSFTATVTSAGGTPTGTVQFAIDGVDFGTPVTLSGGVATSATTTTLPAGNHPVTATYSGDADFLPSSDNLNPQQMVN